MLFLHIRTTPFLGCCQHEPVGSDNSCRRGLDGFSCGSPGGFLMPPLSQLHLGRALGSQCQSRRAYVLHLLFNPWSHCSSSKRRGGRTKTSEAWGAGQPRVLNQARGEQDAGGVGRKLSTRVCLILLLIPRHPRKFSKAFCLFSISQGMI